MKGEKIVSVLCKAVVNPRDNKFWPEGWQFPHEFLKRKPCAWVEGVYLRDGEVWLLLCNITDGKLAECKATQWAVESNGWDR